MLLNVICNSGLCACVHVCVCMYQYVCALELWGVISAGCCYGPLAEHFPQGFSRCLRHCVGLAPGKLKLTFCEGIAERIVAHQSFWSHGDVLSAAVTSDIFVFKIRQTAILGNNYTMEDPHGCSQICHQCALNDYDKEGNIKPDWQAYHRWWAEWDTGDRG